MGCKMDCRGRQTIESCCNSFWAKNMEKNSKLRTWSNSKIKELMQDHMLIGKLVVSSVATVLSDLCGLGEWMPLEKLHAELLVAGGAMYVEVFNRGVIPLAYSIRKKNKTGETNTYLDGIYLLFAYFTKPEPTSILGETLLADDDAIQHSSFKIRKRNMFSAKFISQLNVQYEIDILPGYCASPT